MKRGRYLLFIVLFGFAILPFVSAEIFISQPAEIYNLGEWLELNLRIRPLTNTQEFLNADISCGGDGINVYRSFLNINANEEREVSVGAILSKNLLREMRGERCFLTAKYGVDEVNSQTFGITNLIDIEIDMDNTKFLPGERVEIVGNAIRKSGGGVTGFIEAKSITLGLDLGEAVANSDFSLNFTLSENAISGEHDITIRVYEKDGQNQIINEATVIQKIQVTPVLKRLEVVTASENTLPGEEYSFVVNAYDQADNVMNKEITLRIYSPNDKELLGEIILSGSEKEITFSHSDMPGYWKIEVFVDELTARKLFYLEEFRRIESRLENNTLILTNTGNVVYEGPVEIMIGDTKEVKEIDLEVGESKRFRLYAPDGNYAVSISNGEEQSQLGSVALTGKAISVEDIRGLGLSFRSPIIWLILAIVLALIILVIRRRTRKFENSLLESKERNMGKVSLQPISSGKKEESTIIALKLGQVGQNASATVEDALSLVRRSGGKVYSEGDYKILIFSPSATKETENEINAVKVAKRIEETFRDHNRRFKEKIVYGIGANSGEMIVENNMGEFRFTSVGNSVIKAKAMAQESDGEVLLSDAIHRKVINKVKMEKLQNKEAWKITKIADRGKHEDFLNRFTKRNN